MSKKVIVTDSKALSDYHLCCVFNHKNKVNEKKLISKEIVNKRKRGKYFKVDENYFIKLPTLKKKTWKIIGLSLAGLLVAGSAATVTVFYMPHQVSLSSNELELVDSPSKCRLANDYICTFKIKDNLLEDNYMKLMNINSVKVNGKEIPPEGYSFIYQTNKKNQFTINKKYCKGKIEIDAGLVENKQNKNCFFFEYDIDNVADFEEMEIVFPNKGVGDINKYDPIDFSHGFNIDDLYLKDGYNMARLKAGQHTVDIGGGKEIKFSLEHNTLIVREDNKFTLNIKSKDENALPDDIWFRSNARFTKKDEDYTLTYSNDKKSAVLDVAYFFIRDNGSIRRKPKETI